MVKALRIQQLSKSVLITCCILHSVSLAVAFLPRNYLTPAHNVPSTTTLPISEAEAASVSSATIMEEDSKHAALEGSGSSGCQSMIFRYDSPFFPLDRNNGQRIPSALIILNTPIKSSSENGRLSGVLGELWEASSYRICADGGANRLHDATVAMQGMGGDDTTTDSPSVSYLPDLITGDLDSLRPDVRQYYEEKGVSIVRVQDQNFHDLDKSLMAVEKWIQNSNNECNNNNNERMNVSRAFIYGGFGGRFDQEMGNINALCVWGEKATFRETSLALYDEETCAFVLPASPVKSEVRVRFPGGVNSEENSKVQSNVAVGEGPTCGLIPLFGRCDNVITTGLQWDLDGDTPLEFGGLVSSSNRVINEVVTVQTSCPMVFTAEITMGQT